MLHVNGFDRTSPNDLTLFVWRSGKRLYQYPSCCVFRMLNSLTEGRGAWSRQDVFAQAWVLPISAHLKTGRWVRALGLGTFVLS